MITISEKIIHTSLHQVKLYKQGMFWVGYEQSAYYIWQIKGYKPTKKFVKSVAVEVVQIGFTKLEGLLNGATLKIVIKEEKFICLETSVPIMYRNVLIKDRNNELFQYGFLEAVKNKRMIYRIFNSNTLLQ